MKALMISVVATMILTATGGTAWALPDLVIDQVRCRDTAAGGHNPAMHVRVKNQGHNPAPHSLMKVQVMHGGRILATRIVAVPPLAPGAVSPPLFVLTTPHIHPRVVRMKVDAGNQIPEANEANNVHVEPIP